MQEWKMADKSARLKNAGLENEGPKVQGVEKDGQY